MLNVFHCCGKSAKPVVKAIAFIDILVAMGISLAALILITYYPDLMLSPMDPTISKLQSTPKIVSIILLATFFFLEACLFTVLHSATRDRDPGQCENWFKIRLVLLCISIFAVIYVLAGSVSLEQIYISGGICTNVVLYRVYTLMAVKAFYLEIVRNGDKHFMDVGQVLERL